jgi:hypothetical protein
LATVPGSVILAFGAGCKASSEGGDQGRIANGVIHMLEVIAFLAVSALAGYITDAIIRHNEKR